MVTAEAMRANAVFQRSQSAQALRKLLSDTEAFLQENMLTVSAGNGHLTAQNLAVPVVKEPNQNIIRIGEVYASPIAVTASCLVTPNHSSQVPGLVNRLVPVQQFAIGTTQLWITDQQAGCTFLVLDWGGNHYSAVHILPHLKTDFKAVNQFLFGRSINYASVLTNKYLRGDTDTVVTATSATSGEALPQRYIMLQPQFGMGNQRVAQVIGVNCAGEWRFFKQNCRSAGAGFAVDQVRQMEWRSWSDWAYRNNE